jgi:hypothetical protein
VKIAWLRHPPAICVLLVAAPLAVFSWRTHVYDRRPPEDLAQATWLEDGIRFSFESEGLAALKMPVGLVSFNRPQFGDVLELLQRRAGVPFDVRWEKLASARVTPQTVLWAKIKGMTFDRAIVQVCSEVGRYQGEVESHVIGGQVVVARAEDFDGDRVTRVYPAESLLRYYENTLRSQLIVGNVYHENAERWVELTCAFAVYGTSGSTFQCKDGKLFVTAQRWRLPLVRQSLEPLYAHPEKFGLWILR